MTYTENMPFLLPNFHRQSTEPSNWSLNCYCVITIDALPVTSAGETNAHKHHTIWMAIL